MLLLIEGYPYALDYQVRADLTVRDILTDVVSIPNMETTQSVEYVGYCYSKKAQDVVFFLPKVILTGKTDENNRTDTIFGATPQDIIDFDSKLVQEKFTEEGKKEQFREFLSTLSIWIYRTIVVYQKTNPDSTILERKEHQTERRGRRQKHNTLLDVIIALRDFNRNHQEYFTFIAKNQHSGYNKIQWGKTISHANAILQDNRPLYINPINKRRVVNFDEELLVIFFSILNYIRYTYNFSVEINIRYPLISPEKMKRSYIDKNYGCRRLQQIKYKYYSDKALSIWDLCYAFFDREYKIAINQIEKDFLLAKDFAHIFEVMIDVLVGGSDKQQLPDVLTNQKDGKLVDHLFIGQSLIEQSELPIEQTYYIGDSKYYKRTNGGVRLGQTSIYKQFTYAKNIIQWNMNLFLDGNEEKQKHPQLRDPLTEGYNPIPNFFISAHIPQRENSGKRFLSFDDDGLVAQDTIQLNRQFENRLFDRDTLLLCHYDVNFLFIVALYGLDNKGKQSVWREKVRRTFRTKIQSTLNALYEFRVLSPREGEKCYEFIQSHFRLLNGKLYRPQKSENYLILAMMKETDGALWKKLNVSSEVVQQEMEGKAELLSKLNMHFKISAPFLLNDEEGLPVEDEKGSLEMEKQPPQKNILTGVVNKNDEAYDKFMAHEATSYVMTKVPMNINFMAIAFFLPMVGGKIDGYYKVDKVYFGKHHGEVCLKLNLSTYYSLGRERISIFKSKMQPGELITANEMHALYTQ